VLPETRESLIQRLPCAADEEAWSTFLEIYEPLLFRLAAAKGLQSADAEDFVQEVLAAVAKAIGRWSQDASRGSFRAWLFRIAQNLAINFLTRPKHQRLGAGDSGVARMFGELPDRGGDSSSLFLLEYRRELFRWAAEKVQEQVSDKHWRVFWATSVDDRPIADVAREEEMSVGGVYIVRSRITKRIREAIQSQTAFEEPSP
jgi:RNA polymerase sigma-70 factor (ECF subfamily)